MLTVLAIILALLVLVLSIGAIIYLLAPKSTGESPVRRPDAPAVPVAKREEGGGGYAFPTKTLGTIGVLVGAVIGVWFVWQFLSTGSLTSLSSPSLATVWETTRNLYLWVLFLWLVLGLVILFKGGEHSGALQSVLAGIMVVLFIVNPIIVEVMDAGKQPAASTQRQSAPECTAKNPCTLQKKADGSTVPVKIPEPVGTEKYGVCFDKVFFLNRDHLGYHTSFAGRSDGDTSIGNVFWFTPEKDIPLPKYWFTKSKTDCSV